MFKKWFDVEMCPVVFDLSEKALLAEEE